MTPKHDAPAIDSADHAMHADVTVFFHRSLDHVAFEYRHDAPVLRDVSGRIEPGEKNAGDRRKIRA